MTALVIKTCVAMAVGHVVVELFKDADRRDWWKASDRVIGLVVGAVAMAYQIANSGLLK
jgi:hypothetical protein